FDLAIDRLGNVYVAGSTNSNNFPTTSGAYQTSYNGNEDAFISKFDANLSSGTSGGGRGSGSGGGGGSRGGGGTGGGGGR
ncbi:MAG: SBBP repeat-containing protein, partial [Hydrogenobacter sp.]